MSHIPTIEITAESTLCHLPQNHVSCHSLAATSTRSTASQYAMASSLMKLQVLVKLT